MAEMSYLQIHDGNDSVSIHSNRNNHHQRRLHHQSFTRILDSRPHFVQSDDTDFYVSDNDLLDRRGYVMDLFHQRVEQSETSQVSPIGDDDGIEMRLELGLELESGDCDLVTDLNDCYDEDDLFDRMRNLGLDSSNVVIESGDIDLVADLNDCVDEHDDEDDLFDRMRNLRMDSSIVVSESGDIDLVADLDEHDEDDLLDRMRNLGMDSSNVVVESGSEYDDEDEIEKEREIWGIDLNEEDEEEEEVYLNDDEEEEEEEEEDDSLTIPLCWDSLYLEDLGVNNEDFEWEEVDDGDGDGDGDDESVLAEADDNYSVSVSVSASISRDDIGTGERRGNVGWEVLLNSRSLEFNLDDAESNMALYLGDIEEGDYLQIYDPEIFTSGHAKPPASKSFIKNLKVYALTKEDAAEEEGSMCCAVCKEEMSVGNEVAELPCRHKYHSECILPWLGIRNTCPVCRFEVPADEI